MSNSSALESTEIASQVSNTQHTSEVAISERNYDQTIQDIENQNMQVAVKQPTVIGTSFNQQQHTVQDIENPNLEEFDGAPPNYVQQQHTVQDNDGNQNWEGVAPASPSLILQLPNTIQDDGSQTSEPNTIQDDGSQTSEGVAASSSSSVFDLQLLIEDNGSQTSTDQGTGRPSALDIELMYRAAFEGDWDKAEQLLEKDPSLACHSDRRGSRPLHVAAALKHDKFALKLIERMGPRELAFEDSNALTACCYAAASGSLDIAREMIKKNPTLVKDSLTKLVLLAILSGNSEVVKFVLKHTEVDPLLASLWLDVLQNAIETKMNDMAFKILEQDGCLATMRNDDNLTALHMLARQDISTASTGKWAKYFKSIFGITLNELDTRTRAIFERISIVYHASNESTNEKKYTRLQGHGKMPPDFRLLAEKLLAEIQKMDESDALQLLNDPPILHDAAKVGNVDLIRMITRAYPDILWQTDDEERTLFHIAIMSREANVFSFIQRFRALDIISFLFKEDGDENNLLHLAAKLGPRKNAIPALQMQSELAWFKAVEAMLPLYVTEEENKDRKKPRELFEDEHKELLKESKEWMKSTADSCMLIATIILTVVYASAFTVPGGNNEATGLPILVTSNWLTCFFIFEALALFSSTLCIITFWSITCSGFEEDQFFDILPYQLRLGFSALFSSLIGAITAFMSAYHMVLVQGKAWLIKSILLLVCVILVLAILGRFWELWSKTMLPKCLPRMMANGNSQGPYSKRGGKTDENKTASNPAK